MSEAAGRLGVDFHTFELMGAAAGALLVITVGVMIMRARGEQP